MADRLSEGHRFKARYDTIWKGIFVTVNMHIGACQLIKVLHILGIFEKS